MRHTTLLSGIICLLCLLAACGDSHFMTDASYRSRVERDFQQKKALMPQGDLLPYSKPLSVIMSVRRWNFFMPICLWRILQIIQGSFI